MNITRSQFAVAFVTYVIGVAAGLFVALLILLDPLPAKAAEAAPKWTGCYLGAGVSYNSATLTVLGAEAPGVAPYLGCDVQMQKFVVGAWADYSWEWYKFSSLNIDTDGWAVGGRAGYLLTPDVLGYGLVGYGDKSAKLFGTSFDFTGIEYGGGLEVALPRNWYTQLQYKHEVLSKSGLPDLKDDQVRLGLSYKFSLIGFDSPPLK